MNFYISNCMGQIHWREAWKKIQKTRIPGVLCHLRDSFHQEADSFLSTESDAEATFTNYNPPLPHPNRLGGGRGAEEVVVIGRRRGSEGGRCLVDELSVYVAPKLPRSDGGA